jgi:hypothetical protein
MNRKHNQRSAKRLNTGRRRADANPDIDQDSDGFQHLDAYEPLDDGDYYQDPPASPGVWDGRTSRRKRRPMTASRRARLARRIAFPTTMPEAPTYDPATEPYTPYSPWAPDQDEPGWSPEFTPETAPPEPDLDPFNPAYPEDLPFPDPKARRFPHQKGRS